MILDLAIVLALTGILWVVNATGLGSFQMIGDQSALAFGFILLASYVMGKMARRMRMPMITGYLVAGFVFGPYVLGALSPSLRILSPEILDELSIFNSIALGLIAFSAGGEIKLKAIRQSFKSISLVTAGQGVAAAALVIPVLLWVGPHFPLFAGIDFVAMLGVAILMAVIAMANSPSTTLALIIENKAKGPLTTVSLGVTVLKDVMVIVLFSVAMVLAKALLAQQGELDASLLLALLWEVFGSLAIGFGLGYLMGQYMKYVGRELPLILLALSLVTIELAMDFHLSGLLLCMAAGFYVVNFTDSRDLLIRALESYTLPIFVLFFTITGANLQLNLLVGVWPLVLLFAATRALSIWIGTTGGSALAKDPPQVRKNLWLGFLSQAGVTLGLSTLVAAEIPHFGNQIMTIAVAAIAVNQLVGPIAFRYGLVKSGEAHGD